MEGIELKSSTLSPPCRTETFESLLAAASGKACMSRLQDVRSWAFDHADGVQQHPSIGVDVQRSSSKPASYQCNATTLERCRRPAEAMSGGGGTFGWTGRHDSHALVTVRLEHAY